MDKRYSGALRTGLTLIALAFGACSSPPGSGGSAGNAPASGCYSPGQNLQASGDRDAFGCKCLTSQAPNGLCAHLDDSFGSYLCQDGHWKVDAADTACTGCWTPEQPEFANALPDQGCACVNENEVRCVVTQNDGYDNAVCRGGAWKLDPTLSSCNCTTDSQCGFGGKCDNGSCERRLCEVDGVRYAAGVPFPSPSDACNTCQCDASGQLDCTTRRCAPSACPAGTVQASTCAGCGLAGGCGLHRFGCLPRCETSADCARTGTPECDQTNHVCTVTGCD